jgi:Protein kinase domain
VRKSSLCEDYSSLFGVVLTFLSSFAVPFFHASLDTTIITTINIGDTKATAAPSQKHVRVAHNATTPKATNATTTTANNNHNNHSGASPMKVDDPGVTSPEKRIVTMEPSVRSFAGPSSVRRDRSDPVQITDALADVRVKYHINPKELGHGHYGVVRKCMNRDTKEWYAIKSIRKAKVSKIEVLKREIEILKEVRHPNIIELIDVFEDAKYLHLVTELCTGGKFRKKLFWIRPSKHAQRNQSLFCISGELFDRIIAKTQSPEGHYSERDAASLIRDILDAIAYCHSKEIVHRDLKPEVRAQQFQE